MLHSSSKTVRTMTNDVFAEDDLLGRRDLSLGGITQAPQTTTCTANHHGSHSTRTSILKIKVFYPLSDRYTRLDKWSGYAGLQAFSGTARLKTSASWYRITGSRRCPRIHHYVIKINSKMFAPMKGRLSFGVVTV